MVWVGGWGGVGVVCLELRVDVYSMSGRHGPLSCGNMPDWSTGRGSKLHECKLRGLKSHMCQCDSWPLTVVTLQSVQARRTTSRGIGGTRARNCGAAPKHVAGPPLKMLGRSEQSRACVCGAVCVWVVVVVGGCGGWGGGVEGGGMGRGACAGVGWWEGGWGWWWVGGGGG